MRRYFLGLEQTKRFTGEDFCGMLSAMRLSQPARADLHNAVRQGELYHERFVIPALSQTPNQLLYKHWAQVKREKDRCHQLVRVAVGRRTPPEPLRRAELSLVRYSWKPWPKTDFDGLAGSFKFILDGLVTSRVLADDSDDVIGRPVYLWEPAPRGKPRLELEVQEVEA